MCTLNSRLALIPRGILYFGGSMPRLYHHRKLCHVNNFVLRKCLSPSFIMDTWKISRTCHSTVSSNTTPITSKSFSGTLTKPQAKELASKLTSVERDIFLNALNECKSEEDKAGFEGELAAFRWKSKFGRPSKVPSLGDVDPTGTFCRVPEDWLMKKYVENVPEPSSKQLLLVGVANAIPFIGFGFLDNFIMIVAGDQIEIMLNRKFPISTMTAAALGNTVSDIIGIGSVHYVELFAQKIGFKAPNLTPMQLSLPKIKLAANVGRVIGVTIGCIIGMSPIPIFALLHNNSAS